MDLTANEPTSRISDPNSLDSKQAGTKIKIVIIIKLCNTTTKKETNVPTNLRSLVLKDKSIMVKNTSQSKQKLHHLRIRGILMSKIVEENFTKKFVSTIEETKTNIEQVEIPNTQKYYQFNGLKPSTVYNIFIRIVINTNPKSECPWSKKFRVKTKRMDKR
ncbi:hypothetical protein RFI_21346 [Reticulomyxa filosa]|uniref:Fibronectin type-III domain-containing protein n=1 Tax=Reticulomyxa filosa TaxID=46433 RepID=X6MPT9_RETFI|nr:hypothetical protein RFI_21346 [Reticulomyxa filosa]|eukprot:ETO16013.1 hypothetical protein RFI_21346 [Reticulomyxa filosa]